MNNGGESDERLLFLPTPPYERRYDTPFRGPIVPWEQRYLFVHQTTTKDKNRLHQFRSKVLRGSFVGCALNAGSGWTDDLLVADAELEYNMASYVYV